jgi:YspA, cpYpsA-related SLOG family
MSTRILVTGSRDWTDFAAIVEALRDWKATDAVLVEGGARGADRLAATIWRAWGLTVEEHRADWDRHGRRAGYLRNQEMIAAGADVCLAFILDNSRGATHCANAAETAGIPTTRHRATTPAPHDTANAARASGRSKTEPAKPNHRKNVQPTLWTEGSS